MQASLGAFAQRNASVAPLGTGREPSACCTGMDCCIFSACHTCFPTACEASTRVPDRVYYPASHSIIYLASVLPSKTGVLGARQALFETRKRWLQFADMMRLGFLLKLRRMRCHGILVPPEAGSTGKRTESAPTQGRARQCTG